MLSWHGGLAKFEAVRKIGEPAKFEQLLDLAQLASRVVSAMHAETSISNDPFAKVKGLISEMTARREGVCGRATHTHVNSGSRWLEAKGQLITDYADLLLTEDAPAENTAALY